MSEKDKNHPSQHPPGSSGGGQGNSSNGGGTVASAAARMRSSKTHIKVWLKIEQIARLRCAGVNDKKIMSVLGISNFNFHRIIALQEYKDTESALYAGTLTKLDEILGAKTEAMKQYFASAVPAAMRALVDNVLQKRDLRARLEAAKELLDRDPKRSFVKEEVKKSAAELAAEEQMKYRLPDAQLAALGIRGTELAAELDKTDLGPSGKPN